MWVLPVFALLAGVLAYPLASGLLLSLRRGRLPYRMMFFAPVVLSVVAVGSVWKWLYAAYFGLFTNIAASLGLADVYSSLLASQPTALWAIMGAFVWRWGGFQHGDLPGRCSCRKPTPWCC